MGKEGRSEGGQEVRRKWREPRKARTSVGKEGELAVVREQDVSEVSSHRTEAVPGITISWESSWEREAGVEVRSHGR